MKVVKRISFFAFMVLMCIISVYTPVFALEVDYVVVYEEIRYDYDTSSVIADLNDGIEVPENDFVPAKYLENIFTDSLEQISSGVFDFVQDIYVISFIENGYGTDNFGVYVYVYNPNNLDILTYSNKNKVQFSVSNKENDVFRSVYSKYDLILIDKTENNLYYKFKVDRFSLSNYSERYYAVSGIELSIVGNGNATEYAVGSLYYCHSDNNGKTIISRKPLSTIDVDCTHVYYRTDDSNKGRGYSNQLSACYFSLPKQYSFGNNLYGSLSEMLVEFDLRYTKPILLLRNLDVYNDFYASLGLSSDYFKNLSFYVVANQDTSATDDATTVIWYGCTFGYNAPTRYSSIGYFESYSYDYIVDILNWVFCDTSADFNDRDYYFSADNLQEFASIVKSRSIEEFNNLFENRQYFNDNNISLCGFNYGYNKHTYSISENPEQGSVLGYELTFDAHGFWNNLLEFFGFDQTETVSNIAPLIRVDYADYDLPLDEFSEKYLVAKQKVGELKSKLRSAELNQEEVWLFRYDCSEYYGAKAEVYDKYIRQSAYDGLVCQEPVYLDWDILSFTFEQNSINTETQTTKIIKSTVPVVHSPEDVYSDLTRSANDFGNGCDCTDYGSIFTWILFLVGVLILRRIITKIIRNFKGR